MNTLDIAIRQSHVTDAAAIADVHHAAWHHAYAGIIPHKALVEMVGRRDSNWWARVIDRSGAVLIAEMGGELVGYTTFGKNRARELHQSGEIYELYLLPEYQGLGLGKRLFQAAQKALRQHGMHDMVVWVLEDNHLAADFYAARGGDDIAEGFETFDGKHLKKIAFAFS